MSNPADQNPRKKAPPPPTIPLDESIQFAAALSCTAALIANPNDMSGQLEQGESCEHGTARIGCGFAVALLKRLYPGKNLTLLVQKQ